MWRHFCHPENPPGFLFAVVVVVIVAKSTARNKTKADGQHFCDKRTSFTLQRATEWQMWRSARIWPTDA